MDTSSQEILEILSLFYKEPKTDLELLKNLNQAYQLLERRLESRDLVTQTKFALQKWREDYLTLLIEKKPRDLYEQLLELGVYLHGDDLETLASLLSSKQLTTLEKKQGEQFPKLKVKPFKKSRLRFKKWSTDQRFYDYTYHERGVNFRGLNLESGDILMVSPTLESGGLFTVFSSPDSFSAHLAIFVMLKVGTRFLPAVIEIHEHGVRSLPLSHYCDPCFSTYIEVMRDPLVSTKPLEDISKVSFELIAECQGYSFQTDDRDEKHFTCTRLATELWRRLALSSIAAKSSFDIQSFRTNLDHLEFKFKKILEPNDFLVDENFIFVGLIDNQQLYFEVTGRISINAYLHLFSSFELDLKKLGPILKIFLFCTEKIQEGRLLGRFIASLFGYSFSNFPRGSKELLSYFYFTDKKITKLAQKIIYDLHRLLRQRLFLFDLKNFEDSEDVQSLLRKNSNCLKNLF